MTFEMGFVLVSILGMLVALWYEIARPEFIVCGLLVVYLLAGILTPEEALRGFSNQGMLTIALLFIIAAAVQKHGVINRLMVRLLNGSKSPKGSMIRFFIPTALISAFLNNTPIVVMFTPIVKKWCEDRNLSPSKFLMPLSYVTILGGTITLMGTSTNMVVQGMLLDNGVRGLSLFELSVVGIPITIAGIVYLATLGYRLLPERAGFRRKVISRAKEYMAEMTVQHDFPHLNKTVKQAGLRELKGLFLIEIIRGDKRISPVRSSTVIQAGDRLIFTGLISTIVELEQIRGLRLETGSEWKLTDLKNGETQLVEAVVSHQSSLINKSIKESRFRSRFDAGVLAVHRNQERIKSKVGDIVLRPGDTLLLLAGTDFVSNYTGSGDFYVVSGLETPDAIMNDRKKGWLSTVTLGLAIIVVALGWLSMFKAMALVVCLYFLMKIINPEEARKAVRSDVLLLIAGAFGIGAAMTKSGLAEWAASGLLVFGEPLGIFVLLLLVYLLTNLFTELITNSAAAILMMPIGLEVAASTGADPIGFAVIIAIAASASFITPIGYQTNMIVYGPGGYRFSDFVKVGTPLSLIVMAVTVTIVHVVWF